MENNKISLESKGSNYLLALYLITGIAIGYTAWAEYQRLINIETENTMVLILLVISLLSIGLFLTAAFLSLWKPRFALLTALIAALFGWFRYLGFFLGFMFSLFIPLFTIQGFLQVILPSLLLYFSTSFSYWALSKQEETYNPFFWLLSENTIHRLILLGSVIIFGFIMIANISTQEVQTHEMTWQFVRPFDSPCRQRIELSFTEAPNYKVLACSNNLLDYLESEDDEQISVTFEISYSLGIRGDFRIIQAGEWTGELDESPVMQFICKSDQASCYGSQTESPLSMND